MNFLSLICRTAPSTFSRVMPLLGQAFHSSGPTLSALRTQYSLLQPSVPSLVQVCGMKQKGHLKKRCKDCYFVMRQGRLYVMCKSKPRHKQMAMKKSEKNTWILTHATQAPRRPW